MSATSGYTNVSASNAAARVRVFLATYRRNALLERALASLRAQTAQDWICEVHNDCPGNTYPAEYIDSLNDPRFVIIDHAENLGPVVSFNLAFAGCSEAEVIRIHASTVYRVYMLGFLPGFAYLSSVDRCIAMPRRDVPRLKVAAGSVGIAGIQTGVYPCDAPGGWRIIGRTGVKTFEPSKARPFLFQPGQRVKFVPA